LDIVPENQKKTTLQYLHDSVVKNHDYHVDTGILGTRFLFEVLSNNGFDEIAYKVASQKTYPSFGYMIEEGATTLWERWEKLTNGAMNSHNHIMFGTVDSWFYKYIGGINCISPGWEKIKINPRFIGDLKFSTVSVGTIKGEVYCSWEKYETGIKINIRVPVGSTAEVHLPIIGKSTKIEMNGILIYDEKPIPQDDSIVLKNIDNDLIVNTGSGLYEFMLVK